MTRNAVSAGSQAVSDRFLSFEQLHIDVARNSTDNFNPFHDPRRWQRIAGNPFASTIALGFQMEMLAADRVARHRGNSDPCATAGEEGLHFSNFEFHFARALGAGERFTVQVRDTVVADDGRGLSNRVVLRAEDGGLILRGSVSDTAGARFMPDEAPSGLPSLEHLPDRIRVPGTPYFAKRKFLNTSNGKNFVLAALCHQHDYFDELAERVCFPPLFTASLVSCALLEKGWAEHYDFEADPMVYVSHQISVDKRLQRRLRSNDVLHLLVDGPHPVETPGGGGSHRAALQQYRCFCLVHGRETLFRASLRLAPLRSFVRPAAA